MKHYKKSNVIKAKNKILFLLVIIFIGISIQPRSIFAKETTVVKVGYPIVSGFTEIEDGVYTGYAYEYLTEIAKYTGWEYEFIEMSLNDSLIKLRDGEIDIAAGMLQNEYTKELYDFPEENAGYTYTTLSVLKENTSISSSNYETINGITVGYYETSRLNSFTKFCEENGIKDIKLVPYTYGEETLVEALRAKEVDAILDGNLLLEDDQKVVAKFAATPYYFATNKGNKKVLTGLNKAISCIKENNQNYEEKLYKKYFQENKDEVVHLTQEEQDYINHMTPLKAVYVDGFAPMQAYNPKTKRAEGVYIDLVNLIAEKSGLKIELVKARNHEEAFQMMKNKEVDIFATAPDNYLRATEYGYAQTQAYLEVEMVKVVNVNEKNKTGKKTIALPKGYTIIDFDEEYDIHYYDTVEDCLIAVNDGKAYATYGNSYTISKNSSAGYYPNLSIIFNESPINALIGISKPTNLTLLNIINKTVSTLSESEINNIIYSNTMNVKNDITLKQFFFANSSFCISIVMVFVLLLSTIIGTRFKRLAEDKLILLKKSQIDVLTGVYNRATGTDLVAAALQTNNPSWYSALIIIDIDHFKQINDQLGHQKGDELLIEFSQLLKRVFAFEDVIFRLGGDEFIVFMSKLELSTLPIVEKKLEEICQIMDKEVCYKGQSQKISLSIGAVMTNQVYDFDELYQKADNNLYEVKRNGRNGFKIERL